jgi:hypothetical protein
MTDMPNVLSLTKATLPTRSNELTSKRATAQVYIAHGSARVLSAAAAVLAAARLFVGDFGRGDAIVFGMTLLLAGPVEWIIHKFLLHADDDAWTTRRLGTSVGHKQHHIDPTAIESLMLRGIDAAVFVTMFGFVTASWVLPLMWVTGSAFLGPFLTAWCLAAVGLAHYEWVHLLVHTKYRPTSRYYKRLDRNHRLHHFRNENYWLGVTSNLGDRLLRTYPKHKTDVPLSDTARTLGG